MFELSAVIRTESDRHLVVPGNIRDRTRPPEGANDRNRIRAPLKQRYRIPLTVSTKFKQPFETDYHAPGFGPGYSLGRGARRESKLSLGLLLAFLS